MEQQLTNFKQAMGIQATSVYTIGPIFVCEQGAKRRDLDLEIAGADAKHWWNTGKVPLRATPILGKRQQRRPKAPSQSSQGAMNAKVVPLKNPYLAGVLAYLIPGLGHFYQGRIFKACIYSVCILSTFIYGLYLGRWQTVAVNADARRRSLGYYAQVCTGLPALYAIYQGQRFRDPVNRDTNMLSHPITAAFEGNWVRSGPDDQHEPTPIKGTIVLEPTVERLGGVRGTFEGTDAAGNPIKLSLNDRVFEIGRKVAGGPRRPVKCGVTDDMPGVHGGLQGHIAGSIPRKFLDWFEAPLEEKAAQELHRDLGNQFDLARVYTWIAGLLNILAIWDALDGPAYGRGDEEDEEEEDEKKDDEAAKKAPAELSAAKS